LQEGKLDAARRMLRAQIARKIDARLPGHTQHILVGLVGRGIQSSRTPAMHEREGARIGLRYGYVLIDFDELELADEHLGKIIAEVEQLGFAGLNVTHPFKQAALAHVDELSLEAAGIGAVNTIVLRQGGRVGHNTDCWGFAESFREGLPGVSLRSVVQFGAGGAGLAVAHALLAGGVRELTICDIEVERACTLAARLRERFVAQVKPTQDAAAALASADGLVNATPVGMAKYPGLPFPAASLRRDLWVAEIVYFPPDTELLQLARRSGCRTLAGTGMAVFQAVKAFELLTGIAPDKAAMTAHFLAAA
jgi:shikimate dehydrogenase